jgi:hypothetical protein
LAAQNIVAFVTLEEMCQKMMFGKLLRTPEKGWTSSAIELMSILGVKFKIGKAMEGRRTLLALKRVNFCNVSLHSILCLILPLTRRALIAMRLVRMALHLKSGSESLGAPRGVEFV